MDKPLTFVFERRRPNVRCRAPGRPKQITVTLPPNQFVDFGFRLAMEPIASIQSGSPADRAGFRKGDRIVKVNDNDDFDPMRLPTIVAENAGQPMTFEVERPEPGQPQAKTVTLTVTPDDRSRLDRAGLRSNEPLEVPGLGLAYHVRGPRRGRRSRIRPPPRRGSRRETRSTR